MRGVRASHCQNHLHQLHVCLPSGPGRTRLLYRMSMDFVAWTRHIPFIQNFWTRIANQVGPQHGVVPRLRRWAVHASRFGDHSSQN